MTNLEQIVWCQEEPKNNGAWFFVDRLIEEAAEAAGKTGMRPCYAGREVAASPATGYASRHQGAAGSPRQYRTRTERRSAQCPQ